MKNKASLPRNLVAKHFNKSCRPSIIPSKRLYKRCKQEGNRVGWVDLENAFEGSNTQGKEAIELMFDSECEDGVEYSTETDKLEAP